MNSVNEKSYCTEQWINIIFSDSIRIAQMCKCATIYGCSNVILIECMCYQKYEVLVPSTSTKVDQNEKYIHHLMIERTYFHFAMIERTYLHFTSHTIPFNTTCISTSQNTECSAFSPQIIPWIHTYPIGNIVLYTPSNHFYSMTAQWNTCEREREWERVNKVEIKEKELSVKESECVWVREERKCVCETVIVERWGGGDGICPEASERQLNKQSSQ